MAEESARIALRCEEAKSSLELLLNGCGLRKFPDAIFFILKGIDLTKISLSENQLQKIPAKLGTKFVTITTLDLSQNKLKVLPEEFSSLQRLTIIDLSRNDFEVIPEVLRKLPALTTINLTSNKIQEVSREDYDSIPCLEQLCLTGNPLSEEVRVLLQSIVRISIIT